MTNFKAVNVQITEQAPNIKVMLKGSSFDTGIDGCHMGRGHTVEAAINDLIHRVESCNDFKLQIENFDELVNPELMQSSEKSMTTYYEVKAVDIDGDTVVLFGSFNKTDCKHELEAEKASWKAEGNKSIALTSRETEDKPDPSVYPELWIAQDVSEAEHVGLIELENSDNYFEIVKTKTHFVFGNSTNTGLLESGNYLIDQDESHESNLQELILDLETYYTDGKDFTTEPFKANDRM